MMQPDASRHSGEIWDTAAVSPQTTRVDSSRIGGLLGSAEDVRLRLGAGKAQCVPTHTANHCSGIRFVSLAVAQENLKSSRSLARNLALIAQAVRPEGMATVEILGSALAAD